MIPLGSILVATDLTNDANNAVQRAALLAAQHGARLTLPHVIDPASGQGPRTWLSSASSLDYKLSTAQAALGRLACEVAGRHGVQVAQAVVVGHPLEHVCRLAENADLLVTGAGGVNPLRSLILGTPAEQLLRLVRRPVLVAKQAAQGLYQRVMVAVDLDIDAKPIVRSARALAPTAALHVFHTLSSRGMVRLQLLLTLIGLSGAQASVDHGDSPRRALEKQQELATDLVVLGKNGASLLCKFLLDGVPQRMLPAAHCDVLVLPKPAARHHVSLPADQTWLDTSLRKAF